MFDTKKFGAYISQLRKNADMTQSELADKLNLTRQAISKYEVGESFPDISIIILISKFFGITIDELINAGEPTKGEVEIFESIISEKDSNINNVADIVNLAPLLKPSILSKLADSLSEQGIDISNIVILAEFLNSESVLKLLQNAKTDTISDEILEKLIPFLDENSKLVIFEKVLEGSLDWHLLKVMIPYFEYMITLIEAAVLEGVLPNEVLSWR